MAPRHVQVSTACTCTICIWAVIGMRRCICRGVKHRLTGEAIVALVQVQLAGMLRMHCHVEQRTCQCMCVSWRCPALMAFCHVLAGSDINYHRAAVIGAWMRVS